MVRIADLCCGAGGAAMGLHRAFPDAEIVVGEADLRSEQDRGQSDMLDLLSLLNPIGGSADFESDGCGVLCASDDET